MNQNLRKTALLAGVCAVFGLFWSPQAKADSAVNTVQSVQQDRKVTGTVVDAMGPVIGASILEKGTSNGTVTDLDGNYTLSVKPGATLVISYIGYKTQEIKVGNNSRIDVTLEEDNTSLEEVVVVGYGVQKKKLVTGATVQVKGEDIAKLNTTNALTAMQASTPGVQITQASAQPGQGFKVNIRGVGTMGTSSPLLIIDGISSGTADEGLNGLNPADIESIDVLKDAASAAIYGARAANGVILVTTKQGKAGKIQASYDGYVGWSNPAKRPATLNAQEYMQIINELNFNTTGNAVKWNSIVPQAVLDKVNGGWEGTDWFEIYRNKNAMQFNHSFSLTGGSERSKFAMGLNYTSNNGTFGGDMAPSYKRYGGRINSEHVLLKGKSHDIITIGENISFWYNTRTGLSESNGYWNSIQPVYIASPLVMPYNEDGSLTAYGKNSTGYSGQMWSNPLQGLYAGQFNSTQKDRNFGVGATFFWIIEPIKGLRYRGSFNTGYSSYNGRGYSRPFSMNQSSSSGDYAVSQNSSDGGSFSVDNTLTYVLPVFAKNAFDVMIGQSFEKTQWGQSLSVSTKAPEGTEKSMVHQGIYQWPSNYAASQISSFGGSPWGDSALASFFGRVNWNYDEKYMATFTMRADGSSNFARGHRWGYFPSVSAGWVVTNESFMEGTRSWMDFLKIRASWGQNGNCAIPNFQYLATISYSPTDYADYAYKFGSSMAQTLSQTSFAPGAFADIIPNEDITWETSEQLNIGFDARFINSKLGVNFDWYKKTTKDWLILAPAPLVLGTNAPYINGGDIENKGIEVALSWNDQIGKDFRYRANVNFATNKNEVTRIANEQGIINGQDKALFENSAYVSRVQVGHPIAYFYGMDYEGIWQNQAQIDKARAEGKAVRDDAQPGDMIWVDYDGDHVINYDLDRHEIGNPHPDYTLGVSLGFDWKGLDFSVTGSGQFGMQVMQYFRTAQLANPYDNFTQDIFERWHGEGTSNTQPRLVLAGDNNQWVSTRYMQDADFFRIQNVTLGYDVNNIWKSSPFQQLRLYVQAQNLYTFTGYTGVDPEIGSNGGKDSWARGIDVGLYPTSRTFLIGVNIKF
ncbi:MAG: TonB-dependent receptor [Prevotella sp.]|nr:TonB-dependent receptor [Prevotella sp.]